MICSCCAWAPNKTQLVNLLTMKPLTSLRQSTTQRLPNNSKRIDGIRQQSKMDFVQYMCLTEQSYPVSLLFRTFLFHKLQFGLSKAITKLQIVVKPCSCPFCLALKNKPPFNAYCAKARGSNNIPIKHIYIEWFCKIPYCQFVTHLCLCSSLQLKQASLCQWHRCSSFARWLLIVTTSSQPTNFHLTHQNYGRYA